MIGLVAYRQGLMVDARAIRLRQRGFGWAAESNWTKPRPSSIEIARMETAIVWPGRHLGHVPQLLSHSASRRARTCAARRHRACSAQARLPGRLARRWNCEGLDLIAASRIAKLRSASSTLSVMPRRLPHALSWGDFSAAISVSDRAERLATTQRFRARSTTLV
jgi:hypothetical protein